MTFTPIDFYDARSGGHSGARSGIDTREEIAIQLATTAFRSPTGSVLDIGCGDGEFLAAVDERHSLTSRGWHLFGVDFSPYQIERARQHPYNFSECNVEDGLPFGDSCFNVIFCGELIEHVYNPDKLLDECFRVATPGGYLVITTPNLQAWYNRALFVVGVQPLFYETSTRSTSIGAGALRRLKRGTAPVGHIRLFNRQALFDLLESTGFTPLAIRGAEFPLFPRSVRTIDRLAAKRPTLASNLVVLARRAEP
jgi:SAM-dependent methyltransferase